MSSGQNIILNCTGVLQGCSIPMQTYVQAASSTASGCLNIYTSDPYEQTDRYKLELDSWTVISPDCVQIQWRQISVHSSECTSGFLSSEQLWSDCPSHLLDLYRRETTTTAKQEKYSFVFNDRPQNRVVVAVWYTVGTSLYLQLL